MKEAIVKLNDPIQWGSETITSVTIPPLKTKHIRGLKLNDMGTDEILSLLSKVSGLTDGQIDELSIRDMMALAGVLTDFLDSSPQTGNTP